MKQSKIIFLVTFILACFTHANAQKQNTGKPNIVLILIDDEGYGDVGTYGATGFKTPNLDLMANKGMKFTNYYSAQPVCTASRAGLLTGCYPNRIGFSGALNPLSNLGLNKNELTIAEMLKAEGYTTACYGKWHLGRPQEFMPLQHGFDEYFGLPYSNDMWPNNNKTGEKLADGVGRSNYPTLPLITGNTITDSVMSLKDQDKLTTRYTEKAVDFINRNAKKPFFLYVPHSMGHVPLGVSDKFRGKSEQGLYGDVMMEIDWSVGEIAKALKKNNIEDNTIFIFTSDNGPWLNYGNHAGSAGGLREGKLTSWEGGQRVPFIIRWPGQTPEGTVCNQLACGIDILPTLAKITHGKLSKNKIDGLDITSLWKGDFKTSPRETLLYYYGLNNLNAVRKGNWKLVLPHKYSSYNTQPGNDGVSGKKVNVEVTKPELYDMTRDPGERYNVYDSYPEKVTELMLVVEKARAEFGDVNVGIAKGSGSREIGKARN